MISFQEWDIDRLWEGAELSQAIRNAIQDFIKHVVSLLPDEAEDVAQMLNMETVHNVYRKFTEEVSRSAQCLRQLNRRRIVEFMSEVEQSLGRHILPLHETEGVPEASKALRVLAQKMKDELNAFAKNAGPSAGPNPKAASTEQSPDVAGKKPAQVKQRPRRDPNEGEMRAKPEQGWELLGKFINVRGSAARFTAAVPAHFMNKKGINKQVEDYINSKTDEARRASRFKLDNNRMVIKIILSLIDAEFKRAEENGVVLQGSNQPVRIDYGEWRNEIPEKILMMPKKVLRTRWVLYLNGLKAIVENNPTIVQDCEFNGKQFKCAMSPAEFAKSSLAPKERQRKPKVLSQTQAMAAPSQTQATPTGAAPTSQQPTPPPASAPASSPSGVTTGPAQRTSSRLVQPTQKEQPTSNLPPKTQKRLTDLTRKWTSGAVDRLRKKTSP